ncbi:MAG: aldehyde dehydrogenase family protein [Alicyclobacillus sp.]|nr:aldehyde dehydrogenase family protein [Alicyclobacillus sp.]
MHAPYGGEALWSFGVPDAAQLEEIVNAASAAYQRARTQFTRVQRIDLLHRVADELARRRETFTRVIALEAGKPWNASDFEVRRVVDYIHMAAEALRMETGQVVPMDAVPGGQGRRGFATRVPLGTVLAVSPFNAPLNLSVQKIVPALAMGNAVIAKPSPYTPLTTWLFIDMLYELGLPEGLAHFVIAPGHDVVLQLAAHPKVHAVTLTGSTAAGRAIQGIVGVKPCVFELGSSAPNIVFEDVDIDRVAATLAKASFSAAGQACIAAQRLVVAQSISASFLQALEAHTSRLTLGNPLSPDTEVGPMISPQASQRVLERVREVPSRGGTVVCGGGIVDGIVQPTIVTGLPVDDPIHTEEIFGPVVSVIPFRSEDEAVAIANATPYGLQAAVFTKDVDRGVRIAGALDFGSVWVNESSRYRQDNYPFGGMKDSGYGREGIPYVFDHMSQWKFIGINAPGKP